MLKNILNLKGAVELTKKEKRGIKGGLGCVEGVCPKPNHYCCYIDSVNGICRAIGEGCF